MANSTAYYGLEPVGPHNPADVFWFPCDATTAPLYHNDPVKLVADAGVAQLIQTNATCIGVVVGIKDGDGNPALYKPDSASYTGYWAGVIINPDQIYKVKLLAAATAEDIGEASDLVIGTGNTDTGRSGAHLETCTAETANVRILGLCPTVGNAWGASQDVLVQFIEHQFRLGPAGV